MHLRSIIAPAVLLVMATACSSGGTAESVGDEPTPSTADSQAPATTSFAPAESEDTGGEMVSAFELNIGDCFNLLESTNVDEVERVDCEILHDYEIYDALDHPAGSAEPYPGDAEIETFAEDACLDGFEDFVGLPYEESELYVFYLQPSADTWGAGDREVICTVYLQGEQMAGSMEGSER